MSWEAIIILILSAVLAGTIAELVRVKLKAQHMKRDLAYTRELLMQHWGDLERCFGNIKANIETIEDVLDGRRANGGLGRAVQSWTGEILPERGTDSLPRQNLRIGHTKKSSWTDSN